MSLNMSNRNQITTKQKIIVAGTLYIICTIIVITAYAGLLYYGVKLVKLAWVG